MPADRVKETLLLFRTAVRTGDPVALTAVMDRLDGLVAGHRSELHPLLAHFLEGRCYAKAMAWLGLDCSFIQPAALPGCFGEGRR